MQSRIIEIICHNSNFVQLFGILIFITFNKITSKDYV